MSRQRYAGFTLLELLVVLGILGFVGIGALQMVRSGLSLQGSIQTQTEGLEQAIRVWAWLEQDVTQSLPRPIRDELGEPQPALQVADGVLALTHSGWENPLQEQRSRLQRVVYEHQDEQLVRRFWQVLDRDQDSEAKEQRFAGVTGFSVEVLGNAGWQAEWPPEETMLPGGVAAPVGSPIAVRIQLNLSGLGEVTRVFELPSLPVVNEVSDGN